MSRFRICGLLIVATSTALLAAEEITLRIPLLPSEEIAIVHFDDSRVSVDNVKQWMQLADGAYYSAPAIQYYSGCKSNALPQFTHRLQRGVELNRKIVQDLDPAKFAPELSDVVSYLRRLQSFWLWQGVQELQFLETGTSPGLEFDGIDARQSCASVVDQIGKAPNQEEACKLAVFSWHNCVANAARPHLGIYPREKWTSFLQAYGIHEERISTAGD